MSHTQDAYCDSCIRRGAPEGVRRLPGVKHCVVCGRLFSEYDRPLPTEDMVKCRTRGSIKVPDGPAFRASREGDAVRIDWYEGARKVKNYCYFLDLTTWPAEPIDQINMAFYLLRNPTLLSGRSFRHERPSFWEGRWAVYAEAMAKAINEVADAK